VRVERAKSLSLEYVDEQGRRQEWQELDQPAAELLQHEIDHLDGVLAVDRAMDAQSLVMRREYERNREFFDAQVDYAIVPTISLSS